MFDCSLDGNRSDLVFVEAKKWLLRTRFFPDKSAHSLVKGIGWLRTFVRRTTRTDLPELHGDSGTSWTVHRRCRGLSTAVATSTRCSRPYASSGARQTPGVWT